MPKLNANLLPPKEKPGLILRRAGRPAGSLSPTPRDRITRSLPMIYESIRRNALAGDAEAARLCADIARDPDKFPSSDQRGAVHELDG